jgi:hypothetical protein
MNLLAPLMDPSWVTWSGVEELSDILNEAVELSKTFRHQLPYWSVRFHPMPSSTTVEMEIAKDKNPSAKVKDYFVVFPGLYKRGTLEGNYFEKDHMVKEREVVVR